RGLRAHARRAARHGLRAVPHLGLLGGARRGRRARGRAAGGRDLHAALPARGRGRPAGGRMRRLAALALLAALARCGSPAADPFVVKRSGADRNANVTLLVSDDGTVTCNGKKHEITGDELLRARALTRSLEKQAQLNLALPPGPNPILSYNVRMQAGT